jgi:hypothetical protein
MTIKAKELLKARKRAVKEGKIDPSSTKEKVIFALFLPSNSLLSCFLRKGFENFDQHVEFFFLDQKGNL